MHLDYPAFKVVKNVLQQCDISTSHCVNDMMSICDICQLFKSHQLLFIALNNKMIIFCIVIHIDVWGLFPIVS